jgi:hypothetical protein
MVTKLAINAPLWRWQAIESRMPMSEAKLEELMLKLTTKS